MFKPILLPAHNPGRMTGPGNNTYLLIGPSGAATLIDAGVGEPRHLSAIHQQLSDHHATLDLVLVTHAHPDHASGAPALASAHPDARFYKHLWPQADASYAVDWEPLHDRDRVMTDANECIVLHTPGHSPDHVSFWHESSGTVFTGDLIVLGGSVMIDGGGGGDLAQYLESLERIRGLRPRRLLPAHGLDITDPETALLAYINHRLVRERQVLEALAAGRDSVESIAESIYDGLDPGLMPAARATVRAHLDKLKKEQRAFEDEARWKA